MCEHITITCNVVVIVRYDVLCVVISWCYVIVMLEIPDFTLEQFRVVVLRKTTCINIAFDSSRSKYLFAWNQSRRKLCRIFISLNSPRASSVKSQITPQLFKCRLHVILFISHTPRSMALLRAFQSRFFPYFSIMNRIVWIKFMSLVRNLIFMA